MPVNVAVEEPRARVIRVETERHVVTGLSDVNDIAPDWVVVVVRRAACDADDVQRMAVMRLAASRKRSPGVANREVDRRS